MQTAYQREQAAKKGAKKDKKANEKAEKERVQQEKVLAEFLEKQTAAQAAANDPVAQLKAWCSKPPYLDLTEEIKKNTYNLIITCISQLSKAQQETALWQALDIKEAAILHKYMTAAGNQINKGDQGKYTSLKSHYSMRICQESFQFSNLSYWLFQRH